MRLSARLVSSKVVEPSDPQNADKLSNQTKSREISGRFPIHGIRQKLPKSYQPVSVSKLLGASYQPYEHHTGFKSRLSYLPNLFLSLSDTPRLTAGKAVSVPRIHMYPLTSRYVDSPLLLSKISDVVILPSSTKVWYLYLCAIPRVDLHKLTGARLDTASVARLIRSWIARGFKFGV